MIKREPDLTFVIDMDPGIGLERALGRKGVEERFEGFGHDLQAAMRDGFLALASEFSDRCRVVDGNRAPDEVAGEVANIVRAYLA